MKIAFLLLFVLLAVPESSVVRAQTNRAQTNRSQSNRAQTHRYSCPMQPDFVSSKRGKCPKCGMTLIKKDAHAETKAYPEPAAEPKSSSEAFSSTKIPDAQV